LYSRGARCPPYGNLKEKLTLCALMFFLSKLLPLFIYPLGLVCVLMGLALLLFWKRPRWAIGSIALALTVLLVTGNGWFAGWLVRSLEWQYIPTRPLAKAEAIVVLGGGTKPALLPRPGVDFGDGGDRIFYGSQLYREGNAPLLMLSGGRIIWRGGGSAESEDMATIAEFIGVPRSAMLQDTNSLNTHENAVNVKQILAARGINRILLVTSAMHMPRSVAIFKHEGFEVLPAPTDFQVTREEADQEVTAEGVLLNLVPDIGRLQQVTLAIKEYLGLVIYRLRGWL